MIRFARLEISGNLKIAATPLIFFQDLLRLKH